MRETAIGRDYHGGAEQFFDSGNVPTRDTIPSALNGQDQQIDDLFDIITILEKKLEPVLGMSPLNTLNKALTDVPATPQSVRQRIRDHQRRLENLAHRVSSLTDRVEL